MQQLGFSAQEIDGDNDNARLFITGIAAFLTELGLIDLSGSELSCTASQVFDGVVVELTAASREMKECTEALYVFDNVNSIVDFCNRLSSQAIQMLDLCELYKLRNLYCLIAQLNCSKTYLLTDKDLRNAVFDDVKIQKAREYGKLLSRTPIEAIKYLTNP